MKNIVAFSGSTRVGSFHTRILRSLQQLSPADVTVTLFDLSAVPFYNEDLEGEHLPDAVKALRHAVEAADGAIFAAPEYNFSYSALTKNTIDWLTRPKGAGALRDKKVALICVTPGPSGGKNISKALSDLLPFFGNTIVATVTSPGIADKVASDGDVIADPAIRDALAELLEAFG
ncbi:MAG: NAD(P)H-dependent oxidoreductase [Actinobacteria bacterium]|nr:NAD(P)H-dependent oxidoreductase [Actinomycetota bacterium]